MKIGVPMMMVAWIASMAFPAGRVLGQDTPVILDIRNKYHGINNSMNRCRRVPLQPEKGDPGSLTGYYKGKDLLKVTYETGDNMHTLMEDYYFWRGKLFFVFGRVSAFPVPDNEWQSGEDRFYFYNNRLYRWLDRGRKMVPASEKSFILHQNFLLQKGDSLQRRFRRLH
ncbi:MAG: hypothetical protein JXA20_18825 [Spirochaetes bacterium]|nr:hypothetical protein [Spirochaetota bacterium]